MSRLTSYQERVRGKYPDDWPEIAQRIKDEAGWCCVRCDHPHDVESGYILTVHHFDIDPTNNRWWNTAALCQRCHLSIQARVNMARPYPMFDHSEWFKPYVAGFYAFKYLAMDITREEAIANIEWYSTLERRMV